LVEPVVNQKAARIPDSTGPKCPIFANCKAHFILIFDTDKVISGF